MRFGDSLERSYWSFLTSNGHISKVGSDLGQKLKERVWTRVQTCIVKAKTCKVLLISKDSPAEKLYAKILELSSEGELLSEATVYQPSNQGPSSG